MFTSGCWEVRCGPRGFELARNASFRRSLSIARRTRNEDIEPPISSCSASVLCRVHTTSPRRVRSASPSSSTQVHKRLDSAVSPHALPLAWKAHPTKRTDGWRNIFIPRTVDWSHNAAFSTCASWSCFAATSKTVAEIPQRIFIPKTFLLSLNPRAQTQRFDLGLNSPRSHVAIDA